MQPGSGHHRRRAQVIDVPAGVAGQLYVTVMAALVPDEGGATVSYQLEIARR